MNGYNLKKLLKKHNLTQNQLAQKLTAYGYRNGHGIKTAAISKYALGQRKMTAEFIEAVLKVLGETDANVLISHEPIQVQRIRITGSVSCGLSINDVYECEDEFTYIPLSQSKSNLKAARANGDSMFPIIEDGDIIIYDTDSSKPRHGDLVVYMNNNEIACKIFVEKKDVGIIEFKPVNQSDNFKTTTFRIDIDNMDDLKIYKVIKIQKTPNNPKSNLKLVNEN
ncbi:LexA family transcriptional regulator [Campylobacter hepaticus]|uniref:LexA family transcriptional regulator n=1 Tax=Campylobacter hepaticus TaxID=1813019 RepID=A0A424YYS3_9BACT|nr:LexA family transcriptional regulator [Campylobacter hepaticus]RQD66689.1 LexA family transcriptional regulator [Campylobacter hepaticus]RQD86144.1 LexA family transcriptional regulator [Campylobacter hepaticus]